MSIRPTNVNTVSIDEIAAACAGRIVPQRPGPDGTPRALPALVRVGSLDDADPGTLTFIRSPAFIDRWQASHAGAALVSETVAAALSARDNQSDRDMGPGALPPPADRPLVVVSDTDLALAAVVPLFISAHAGDAAHDAEPGVHPGACVHPSAAIDPTATVGPGCHVGPGATVGAGACLMANVVIGARAAVGAHTTLHAGVVLGDRCTIGTHGLVFANAVIGADGFNFRHAPDGSGLIKIPHIAAVRIGNHVEIGALAAIDRGKFEDTVIGDGTKIDNLVQIGHNCRIGRCCMICGRVGLSGSVTLGDGVVLAGGVGIADNLTIGNGAIIGANAGVMNDIPPGETWLGAPAQPVRDAMANLNAFRSLSADLRALRKQGKALAARLEALSPPHPTPAAE